MLRSAVLVLAATFVSPAALAAQVLPLPPSLDPGRIPVTAPVLGEHATGGEVPVLLGMVSVAGLAVYDVWTAPAAARRFNERQPGELRRSPTTALLLSAAATAVPIAVGSYAYDRSLSEGGELVAVGVVVGPSVGHWYAGDRPRALRGAGARALLVGLTAYMYGCCT